MKKLSKVIIKLLYVIIFPTVIIGTSIYKEMNLYILTILTALCILQSVLWYSVMQNVKLLPSTSIETYKGFCFGIRFMDKINNVIIVFPFVVIDLEWR